MEKTTNHLLKKIAILGAESTGKSTICNELAIHYNSLFVPEYARTYFNTHNIDNLAIRNNLIKDL